MRLSPVNLKTLAYTLDVEGHAAAPVLQACGLPSFDELNEDGPWVHIDVFARMVEAALQSTGDPHFGLVAGKSLALMKYGAIIPVMLSGPNLRQLMRDLERFALLSVERCEMRLHDDGTSARLVVETLLQHGESGRFRMEQISTSAVQLLRFTGAMPADIFEVELPLPEPADAVKPRYAAAFGARIVYNRPHSCVHFHPRLLDQPLAMHDPIAYSGAVARAEALLQALQSGNGVAEQVRQVLLAALPVALSVAETADRVGFNERQLRRQLAALGTSHGELLQQCQRVKAERLIAEGRMPIKQVADELGFGSVHSFHRAFKRWTGVTPTTFKQG